jgi:hypothetical protein
MHQLRVKNCSCHNLPVRLNENELVISNQRLKLFGFNRLNKMVLDLQKESFP